MNWDSFLGNLGWILAVVQVPGTLWIVFWKVIPGLNKLKK